MRVHLGCACAHKARTQCASSANATDPSGHIASPPRGRRGLGGMPVQARARPHRCARMLIFVHRRARHQGTRAKVFGLARARKKPGRIGSSNPKNPDQKTPPPTNICSAFCAAQRPSRAPLRVRKIFIARRRSWSNKALGFFHNWTSGARIRAPQKKTPPAS